MDQVQSTEKRNIAILALSQTLFMIVSITVMTLSGVVGYRLSPEPGLATLPIAMMMVGAVVSTLPASLFMKRVGRRVGFLLGAAVGGIGGGLLAFVAVALDSFWWFCAGNLLLGLYQGFAMYYRFAAVDVASPGFRSRAMSLVLAGGVAAAFLGPWNASLTNSWIPAVRDGGPYVMIAVMALLSVFFLHFLRVPASGEPQPGERSRRLGELAGFGHFRLAVLTSAVGYAIMILVMTATPLAMRASGFEMEQVAFIMQWHVLGMFVPSFFTGSLIARFGVLSILLCAAVLLAAASLVAFLGVSLPHFWLSLVLLGVGWNFSFIGGSALLASTHSESERGKVQGVNDLIVLSLVAIGSLMAGTLFHQLGWSGLNVAMLPASVLIAVGVVGVRFTDILGQRQL